ncbi:DJ-1/PfpI family protein [Segetibacter aerophilus]|uniref:Dimethyladenosine transferase n=1 Tax=Segetibacter aerophilus TaxID=670293 RepID=A0A512BKA8_9BACT|nr:DJ-1/PfpI family protein [Segetibacter aerophilus]GEO12267.1 dimethyladenosine transferase [Segetibacter aerophilus]
MNVTFLLFQDFETLDVFGPVEIFGRLKHQYKILFCSLFGGRINNEHGVAIETKKIDDVKNKIEILIIPGGHGTRKEVTNMQLIDKIKEVVGLSKFVMTVCTGSGLLAKTGMLDGRVATSNKKAFDWAAAQGENVKWIRKARWTKDEKFYTSAGVSAGIDMSLGFLSDIHGIDFARKVAFEIEYNWTENMNDDNFYEQ